MCECAGKCCHTLKLSTCAETLGMILKLKVYPPLGAGTNALITYIYGNVCVSVCLSVRVYVLRRSGWRIYLAEFACIYMVISP